MLLIYMYMYGFFESRLISKSSLHHVINSMGQDALSGASGLKGS